MMLKKLDLHLWLKCLILKCLTGSIQLDIQPTMIKAQSNYPHWAPDSKLSGPQAQGSTGLIELDIRPTMTQAPISQHRLKNFGPAPSPGRSQTSGRWLTSPLCQPSSPVITRRWTTSSKFAEKVRFSVSLFAENCFIDSIHDLRLML